jgi:hypothetical protein
MSDLVQQIAGNLREVQDRIAQSAAKSGRSADEVKLVAVTKYVGEAEIRALVRAGCDRLGESRPQQLFDKAPKLADLPIRWHMIGHLQRNKVRRTLPLVEMIHSADGLPLIEAIDRVAGESEIRMPLLLEVNISGETAKHGFGPDQIAPALETLATLPNVEIRGLMCMAGLEGGPDAARADFAALRGLRDRLRADCPREISLEELSMGMSGDYQAAIEEGATIVRIGSALFEGIRP